MKALVKQFRNYHKNLLSYANYSIIAFVALSMLIVSCEKEKTPPTDPILDIEFGERVQSIEEIGYFSLEDAKQQLELASVLLRIDFEVETECGFTLYRIIYKTTNYNDTEVWVSGLLGVPESEKIKGLVCYQHGTTPDRTAAPSTPSTYEGVALSSVFAADGYLFIAADYIGLGESFEVPTYMHTESTVNAVVDYIDIGEKVLNELTEGSNNKLFLLGFSQGGHATAATQQSLEIQNPTDLNLVASACVAGAYNLHNYALPFVIEQNNTYYTAYLSNSYAMIYNHPLESVIKTEWADSIPKWFDGSKSTFYVQRQLPDSIAELMQEDFIDDIETGNDNWLTLALAENSVYDWKPIHPMRIYYGEADLSVDPQDAISTYHYMNKLGGNVELINIGDYDHMNTIYHAVPGIQSWFNEK